MDHFLEETYSSFTYLNSLIREIFYFFSDNNNESSDFSRINWQPYLFNKELHQYDDFFELLNSWQKSILSGNVNIISCSRFR